MSKELLQKTLHLASGSPYVWTLYFFKIDRRSAQPYIVHKKRFRNNSDLQSYANALIKSIDAFQLTPVEKIQLYTGENSKISCDKISLNNDLIKDTWESLYNGLRNPSGKAITGKYHGYILTGVPSDWNFSSVTFIKMCNPIVDFKKQKHIVFRYSTEDELCSVSDELCRLYMNTDMIIIEDSLYSFNLNMEKLFNMEKTMQKIKNQSINLLSNTNAFSDNKLFVKYANSYSSARTFLTLNPERLEKLYHKKTRKEIANTLGLKIDKHGLLFLRSKQDVSLIIRYICFKIFKDDETKDLLEATNVSKITL